jgi:hypothetical protein
MGGALVSDLLFLYGFPDQVTLYWYSIARLYDLAIY